MLTTFAFGYPPPLLLSANVINGSPLTANIVTRSGVRIPRWPRDDDERGGGNYVGGRQEEGKSEEVRGNDDARKRDSILDDGGRRRDERLSADCTLSTASPSGFPAPRPSVPRRSPARLHSCGGAALISVPIRIVARERGREPLISGMPASRHCQVTVRSFARCLPRCRLTRDGLRDDGRCIPGDPRRVPLSVTHIPSFLP